MNKEGRTVLFATNQLFVLDRVDRIVMMDCGKINQIGTYKELLSDTASPFAKLIEEYNANNEKGKKSKTDRMISRTSSSVGADDELEPEVDMIKEGKLIEKEGLETGGVDAKVFELYFVKAVGNWYVIGFLLFLSLFTQATQNIHDLFFSVWSEVYEEDQVIAAASGEEPDDYNFRKNFIIWASLGVFALCLALARAYAWAWQGISASLNLHDGLLENVLKCKMSFFDTTPMGRILNR